MPRLAPGQDLRSQPRSVAGWPRLRYVMSTREASVGQNTFVLACDAHDGCGRKLFNTIGLFNGVAFVAPPQAPGLKHPGWTIGSPGLAVLPNAPAGG